MWQLLGPLWQLWHMAPDESSFWMLTSTANCCVYHVQSFYIKVADWMPYSCWDLAHHWHLTKSAHIAASGVMHHATTAVLWLQCAAAFILLYVRVLANVMPCGHQNSNLSLSQGCNEPLVATGWAFDDAQGHGPGWELEFWCSWLLRIVACMWWNLST